MKRFLKYTLITLLALPLLAAAFLWGLYLTADMEPPAMTVDTAAYRVADHGGYTSCRGSFLRHNRYGLWELYTAGSPEESGAAAGALTAGLMRYQEQVFVDQIRQFIPSDGYLKFLRGLIVIFNRKDEFWGRAVSTVEKINTRTSSHAILYDLADLDQLKKEMADSYIFVNATGVGMKPLEGQSVVPDKSYFRPELIVVDVPYSPLETAMRSMAKEVGCKTMNGLGMMLFQGSAAFELWTGEPMPIEHMKEILNIRYDD